ncbi:hypothetical protein Tco_1271337, partial [Tanacetum coccineum]
MAWVKWPIILNSFDKGGLNIGSLKAFFNLALFKKLALEVTFLPKPFGFRSTNIDVNDDLVLGDLVVIMVISIPRSIPAISCPSCNAYVESANLVFLSNWDFASPRCGSSFLDGCDIPLFQFSWDSFQLLDISLHASKEKKLSLYVFTYFGSLGALEDTEIAVTGPFEVILEAGLCFLSITRYGMVRAAFEFFHESWRSSSSWVGVPVSP